MILKPNHTIDGSITIHSRGGIGNQLFILCAGLALADQNAGNLYIDASQHQFTKDLPCCCSYNEPSFNFNPSFFALQPNVCVFGYFQSWRYLEQLSRSRVIDIRSAIHQVGRMNLYFEPEDIVIHFRRGDYLNPGTNAIHGVLGMDYYHRAINQLRKIGYGGSIWSISESNIEDIQTLEKKIGSNVKQVIGTSIWQDLSLLTKAPSLVVANSTFSWMGGWFGKEGRSVVAPSPWFRTPINDTSDLIPPTWRVLSHDF